MIDAARLARAVHLTARRTAPGRFAVIGGERDHTVTETDGLFMCDCADAARHVGDCKHVLRVRLHAADAEVLAALRGLVVEPKPARTRRKVAA